MAEVSWRGEFAAVDGTAVGRYDVGHGLVGSVYCRLCRGLHKLNKLPIQEMEAGSETSGMGSSGILPEL